MADHDKDIVVGYEVLGVRHSHIRFRLIVKGDDLERVTKVGDLLARLLDGQLRSEFDGFTQGRLAARERTLGGDLDRAFGYGCRRSGRCCGWRRGGGCSRWSRAASHR